MSLLVPMTDLDAVNKMLKSIGQAPVNSILVSGIGDVTSAVQDLTETSRDIQTVGWWFNIDDPYTLTPDVNGVVAVPTGSLSIDPTDKTLNVAERRHPDGRMALWDSDNGTFVFSAPVDCKVIWGFEFNDLPQAAKTYISTAAARRFQARKVSSTVLDKFNETDEERAWTLLQRADRRNRDTNLFRANSNVRRFFSRRRF